MGATLENLCHWTSLFRNCPQSSRKGKQILGVQFSGCQAESACPREEQEPFLPQKTSHPGGEARFLDWKQDEIGCESVLRCLLWPCVCMGGGGSQERAVICQGRGKREGTHVFACTHVHLWVRTCMCVCVVCLHVPTQAWSPHLPCYLPRQPKNNFHFTLGFVISCIRCLPSRSTFLPPLYLRSS